MSQPAHSQNSFDLLRLLAAGAVLYSHSFALLGLHEPSIFGTSIGGFAVYVFFAISGYLVCRSWEHDPRIFQFLIKRALRIFPGLTVALIFTTLIIGPIFTTLSTVQYFGSWSTWIYLFSKMTTLGTDQLPGLFALNPFPNIVNGSLWTLPYEVGLYLCLAFLATNLVSKRSFDYLVFGFVMIFAVIWIVWSPTQQSDESIKLAALWRIGISLNSNFFNFGIFFFIGGCLSIFSKRISLSIPLAAVMLLLCWLAESSPLAHPILWISIPYAVVVLAYKLPKRVSNLTNGSDISYGIYIYAFPIQQIISATSVKNGWPWEVSLATATVVTAILAILSWFFVEKPALMLKNKIIEPNPMRFETNIVLK